MTLVVQTTRKETQKKNLKVPDKSGRRNHCDWDNISGDRFSKSTWHTTLNIIWLEVSARRYLIAKDSISQEFNLTKIDLNSPKMECPNKQIWIWQDTCSTMKSCNKSFLLHPCFALMDRRFMGKHCNLRFYFYMMLNNTHKYRLCNDERERSPSLLLWHLNWWKCQCSNELQCKQDTQCSSDVKVDTAILCRLQYQWNQDTIVQ